MGLVILVVSLRRHPGVSTTAPCSEQGCPQHWGLWLCLPEPQEPPKLKILYLDSESLYLVICPSTITPTQGRRFSVSSWNLPCCKFPLLPQQFSICHCWEEFISTSFEVPFQLVVVSCYISLSILFAEISHPSFLSLSSGLPTISIAFCWQLSFPHRSLGPGMQSGVTFPVPAGLRQHLLSGTCGTLQQDGHLIHRERVLLACTGVQSALQLLQHGPVWAVIPPHMLAQLSISVFLYQNSAIPHGSPLPYL